MDAGDTNAEGDVDDVGGRLFVPVVSRVVHFHRVNLELCADRVNETVGVEDLKLELNLDDVRSVYSYFSTNCISGDYGSS